MKKLLLLTISMVSFIANNFAADSSFLQSDSTDTIFSDSLIVSKGVLVDPKDGFKDLFEKSSSTNEMNTTQLNPLAIAFVEDYVDKNGSNLNKMKSWGKPYFEIMNTILAQHGLPTELKYLSVIESALKKYAVSWVGAAGPWQFMPETARNMGLKVNRNVDERTDYYKSTHAAARYLTRLYSLYGDWLLVIAAYNGGPGNVNAAIKKSGSRNFWKLQKYLPAESRSHVKKFIATHYIMEGIGGITTLTKSEAENALLTTTTVARPANTGNLATMNVSGKYNAVIISQKIGMDYEMFNKINPGFDKVLAEAGDYELRLPEDKMMVFQANKPQILEQSIRVMLLASF